MKQYKIDNKYNRYKLSGKLKKGKKIKAREVTNEKESKNELSKEK